eukprot:scaffold14633_cov63-Phaeocystis_antarctica.AAC.5
MESAFLATMMLRVGKRPSSLAWYRSGSPTVSTVRYLRLTPRSITRRTSSIAASCDCALRL